MVKTASVNKISKKRMSATGAAYMAGFLDGEGTITLVKATWKRNRAGFQYQPLVSLANTNRGVLEQIVGLCGNGRITVTNSPHVTHKLGYCVRFSTNQIRHVLPQLLPYLRIKKRQAQLLLKFLSFRTAGKHLSDETYRRMEDIRMQLRGLNQRGTTAEASNAEWEAIRPSRLGNNQWVKA